jgi:trimeric autotransporter adhesin
MKLRVACVVAGFLSFVVSLAAQTSGSSPASAQVPPLIQFSNVASDEGGNTLSGVVSITFSLYTSQRGGEPLWRETQNNVQLDSTGHYSVQLGITKSNGVPTALFTTGEARWLGVRIAEQAEQPRVLLVSVPYALKAGDAATVGGLPPSAFVLAAPSNGTGLAYNPELATGPSVSPATSTDVTTPGGTVNYLPLWDTTSDIISSVIFQSGSGATAKVGINNAAPASTLDVKGNGTIRGPLLILGTLALPATGPATATAGRNSEPQTLTASAFNSGTSTAVNQLFQWQAEPVNNDTSTASGSLNLLFAQGTAKPAETGLNIASNGQITFASGQTFPGTGTGNGTVTSVAAGTGLTASPSPITGSGTLSIATGGVTNAMLAKPSLTVAAGTGLIGGGLVALGGSTAPITLASNTCTAGSALTALPFTCSPFAALGTNTFTGNQTVNGNVTATNLTATGTVTGSVVNATTGFDLGGNLFGWGSPGNYNAFLGFASGNPSSNTGGFNTGTGAQALYSNQGGSYNTATGTGALESNQGGSYNTAAGDFALLPYTSATYNTAIGYAAGNNGYLQATPTGSNNTFVGSYAVYSTADVSNATAIGANAAVGASNALVLGSINGVNQATASVSVGIGTITPAATLDVIDNGLYANGSGKNATISATSSAVNSAVSGVNKSTSGLANGATFVTSSPAGTGVVAINYGSGGSDYAGFFQGNVYISGNLAKSTGTFQIDHPLDPANKYLYHSFVESPDMMNIYNGVATLDARGSVWVTLPNYFEALNQEFRYQLTSIGRPQPSLYVAKEISGNRFRISGGKPGGKVSWQVTGIRHDAYADAHRIKVEVEKSPQEQGRYLHPELFGAPAEQAIGYQVPPAPLKPLIEAESAPEQSLKARPATLR